jgi:hypothetical protein
MELISFQEEIMRSDVEYTLPASCQELTFLLNRQGIKNGSVNTAVPD